jgi:hypothetical protein
MRKTAMDLIKALLDPDSDASILDLNSSDIADMEAVAWTIDENGNDITRYGNYGDDDKSPLEW